MPFNLNFHMFRLLREEPFFAALSRNINKRSCDSIPTAAVGFNKEDYSFELLYNESFMESLSDEHRIGVIKHELYHIIYKHLTKRLTFDMKKEPQKAKLWNIATDLAINTHIADELPEIACIPGGPKFEDYPPGLSSEAYYERLQSDFEGSTGPFEEGGQGTSGEGGPATLDDHSGWGSGSDLGSNIANEKIDDMLKKSAEEAESSPRGWGSVPHEVRDTIKRHLTATVDPETVLRYFVRASQKSDKKSTIRRINRRYPFIHPGTISSYKANIAISIDQSGSVNNNMLKTFFSFLNRLATIATFTVIPFDTSVDDRLVYVWKKGEKRKWERVKRGGTCFNAPTKWVNQRNFDGHIIITDMQAPKPVGSKCQRVWITDSYHYRYRDFETDELVIKIDP